MPPIINPFTGRKVRTECSTWKRVAQAIAQDPELLYETLQFVSPAVFAENYSHVEALYSQMPPYDPNKTKLIFHPNGKWEHALIGDRKGTIPRLPQNSTVYSASLWPRPNSPNPANECYMATLETLDNWSLLPRWRMIETPDNYVFDLYFLIKLVINNLNEIKNGNAYPIYPKNPFTNREFDPQVLAALTSRIKMNQIKTAAVLTVFLRDTTPRSSPMAWIDQFEAAGLRYFKDYDGTGYWDLDNHPLSRALQEALGLYASDISLSFLNSKSAQYYWQGAPKDPGAAEAAQQSQRAFQAATYSYAYFNPDANADEDEEGEAEDDDDDDEYDDDDEDELHHRLTLEELEALRRMEEEGEEGEEGEDGEGDGDGEGEEGEERNGD